MQTIAHNLVFGFDEHPALRRSAIITTLAPPVILPVLRDVIKVQVQEKLGQGHADTNVQVRQCLECISVSRVFDVEGLWEVLSELETESPGHSPVPSPEPEYEVVDDMPPAEQVPESSPLSSPLSTPPASSPVTLLPPPRTRVGKTEIMDSEDEDELSSPEPASPAMINLLVPVGEEPPSPVPGPRSVTPKEDQSNDPGVILITHFSVLLNTLFTQRDRTSAHTTLQLLASHLRYLSHSSGQLIILLNSTSNAPSNAAANSNVSVPTTPGAPRGKLPSERPLDTTLRSIFNPPPPSHAGYGSGSMALSRKNKPAFGMTFTQFLDLHLLCTRLPKTRSDAETVFGPTATGTRTARYATIVEVLLDEAGYWDKNGKRDDREQRWGAVDVKDGKGIVDAFTKQEKVYDNGMFRLAAGFGGRRV